MKIIEVNTCAGCPFHTYIGEYPYCSKQLDKGQPKNLLCFDCYSGIHLGCPLNDLHDEQVRLLHQIRSALNLKRYADKKKFDAVLWMHIVEELNSRMEEK